MPVTYTGSGDARQDFQRYLIDEPPSAIAIDIETISLKERLPLGFSIAVTPDTAFYFQVYPEYPRELELIIPLLSNPTITKVAHNWMFDLHAFPLIPVVGSILDRTNLADTNIMARLLGYTDTKLSQLAPLVGKITTNAKDMLGPGQNMLDLAPEAVAEKCQDDTRATLKLYHWLKPKVDAEYKEYFKTEMAVMPVLIDMGLRGLRINQKDREALEKKLDNEIDFYTEVLKGAGIEKPSSNQQVGYILAKRGNFLPFTRSRKQLSTSIENLEFLEDPLAAVALAYRKAAKLQNTYIRPLAGSDRIYTEYHLDAIVGRVSSANRNLQNIPPGEARSIFMPDSGTFTTVDYAQEHLYILMYMSGDRQMERVYLQGEMDGDIHAFTARQMGIPRRLAKTINYAILYGATAKTISEQTKIRDQRKCYKFLDQWFEVFKGVKEWVRGVQQEGLATGWSHPTLWGRKIRLPMDSDSEDGIKRKAVNYPIIGSDGEVIKRAILMVNSKGLGPPTLAVTVHDSLTFDGDVELPIEELENIPPIRIPIKVTKTLRWE